MGLGLELQCDRARQAPNMLGRGIDWAQQYERDPDRGHRCQNSRFILLQEDLGASSSDDESAERASRLDEKIRRVLSFGQQRDCCR